MASDAHCNNNEIDAGIPKQTFGIVIRYDPECLSRSIRGNTMACTYSSDFILGEGLQGRDMRGDGSSRIDRTRTDDSYANLLHGILTTSQGAL